MSVGVVEQSDGEDCVFAADEVERRAGGGSRCLCLISIDQRRPQMH